MAILSLLSASNLQGFYDLKKHELKLSAVIDIENITWGIEFIRVPWVGGDKFELKGWVGPPTLPRKQNFEQTFNLPSLLHGVLVCDQEHPNGIKLDVHVVGGLGDANQAQPVPSTLTNLNEVFPVKPVELRVLYKEPFQISLPAEVPKLGEILPTFDPSYLQLQDARIIDGNIVWTFLPVSTGNTQAIFNILGGIQLYHKTVTYNIIIFIPFGPGPVIESGSSDSEILSFLGRVGIARDIVDKQWDGVTLVSALGKTNVPGGVDSVTLLTNMTIIFRVDGGHVTIESTGYSEFGPPTFVGSPLIGPGDVDWPVNFTAEEANTLLYEENYKGNFTSVQLDKALIPGSVNTYTFNMVDGILARIVLLQKDIVVGGAKPAAKK